MRVRFFDGPLDGLWREIRDGAQTYRTRDRFDSIVWYYVHPCLRHCADGTGQYYYFADLQSNLYYHSDSEVSRRVELAFEPSIIHDFDLWFRRTLKRIEMVKQIRSETNRIHFDRHTIIERRNLFIGATS